MGEGLISRRGKKSQMLVWTNQGEGRRGKKGGFNGVLLRKREEKDLGT